MGMELPGWLTGTLGAIGMEWPKGDETALDRMADHWTSFGSDVDQLTGDLVTAANSVLDSIDGETHDALQTHLQQFFSGDKSLEKLKQDAEYLAECCSNTSNEILALKIIFIVELVALAAFIIAAAATAWINWGAPAEILAEELLTQATLRMAVKNTIERIAIKFAERALEQIGANTFKDIAVQAGIKAGIGALTGSGVEVGKQAILHFAADKDFDWKKVAIAGGEGAAANVLAAPLSMGVNTAFAKKFGAEFYGNKMRWIPKNPAADESAPGALDIFRGGWRSLSSKRDASTLAAFKAMGVTSFVMLGPTSVVKKVEGFDDGTPAKEVGSQTWKSLTTVDREQVLEYQAPPLPTPESSPSTPSATPSAPSSTTHEAPVGPQVTTRAVPVAPSSQAHAVPATP